MSFEERETYLLDRARTALAVAEVETDETLRTALLVRVRTLHEEALNLQMLRRQAELMRVVGFEVREGWTNGPLAP